MAKRTRQFPAEGSDNKISDEVVQVAQFKLMYQAFLIGKDEGSAPTTNGCGVRWNMSTAWVTKIFTEGPKTDSDLERIARIVGCSVDQLATRDPEKEQEVQNLLWLEGVRRGEIHPPVAPLMNRDWCEELP